MPEPDSKLSKIGGFELLATLGKGGMGVVFKARQVSMDRIVALKVLPPSLAKNEAFVQRFLREARSAARLNHPNIVQGIDVGQAEGHYYFAMEFVDGTTVRDMIKAQGRLDEKTALNIVGAVARGLEHAAKHGIIHRDIKPDNIMVARDGAVKLADLGLARTTEKPDTMTIEGTALGTPYYMAPEQVRAETDLDTRADIYALGATLFHMVTGEFAFTGANAGAIMARHLSDPVPSAKDKCPEVSRATDELIQRMMAKDPADRPQTPTELLGEIRDALAGKVHLRKTAGGASLPRVSGASLPRERAVGGASVPRVSSRAGDGPPTRSSKATWLAVAAVAVIAIIVAFVALRRGPKPPDQAKGIKSSTSSPSHPSIPPPILPKVPQPPSPTTQHLVTPTPPKAKETPEPKVEPEPVPAAKEDAAAEAKWDALKADAQKLAEAGKFDEAVKALEAAKALPLDGIADLVAESIQSIESIKSIRLKAALAAYQAESDKLWALFKARDYPAADKLLANLPQVPNLREVMAADQEAAKLLKEFWSAVEKGVAARKGTISIAGALGNVTGVENGVITLQTPKEAVTRRVVDLTAKQALTYAAVVLKDDERSRLAEALFRIAEGEDPALADKALAAAGNPPGLSVYKDRLAALISAPKEFAARKAWEEIEESGKANLTKTEAKRVLALLDAFEQKHGGSKLAATVVARATELREQADAVARPKFHALEFDGKLSGVTIPRVDAYDFSGGLTVEVKLLLQAEPQNPMSTIVSGLVERPAGETGFLGGTFMLLHDAARRVRFTLAYDRGDGRIGGRALNNPELALGRWHHIAGSYDGRVYRFYVNGEKKAEAALAIRLRAQESPIRIGVGASEGMAFRGHVRELSLWKIARTDEEILANRDKALRGDEPGLVGYWDFSEGKGGVLHDRSATGNHGTIKGAKWVTFDADAPDAGPRTGPAPKAGEWQSLFDGKSLAGWKVAEHNELKNGEAKVEDGAMLLAARGRLGLVWTGAMPQGDYEVAFETSLVSGHRLASLYFPVGGGHCDLVLGGISGKLVGLDGVDGKGYRDNPALAQMKFETNHWYAVRVRVAGGKVEVWADGARLVELPIAGHTFAVEDQRAALKPLGLSAYQGTTAVRNVRMRRVGPE